MAGRGVVRQQQFEGQLVVQREFEQHAVVRRRLAAGREPGGGPGRHLHADVAHLELLAFELVGCVAPGGHLAGLGGGGWGYTYIYVELG